MLPPGEIDNHIRACARNSRESQKIIYASFYGYAMAICERYGDNTHDATNILNDGFLRIFKNIRRYKQVHANGLRSFKCWMREMMIHAAIEFSKRNYNHDMVSGQDNPVHNLVGENEDTIDELTYEKTMEALRLLSPAYRLIYNLSAIDGWDHDAISDKLKISHSDAKLSLLKARKQLQEILSSRNTFSGGIETSQ